MATKSNNVFVKLQAIGADATARDIDKVRKSLDDLSKARKESANIDKDAAAQQRELVKSTRQMNTALARQNKMMDNLRQSQKMFIQNGKVLTASADKQTSRAIKNQQRMQKINRSIAKGEREKKRVVDNVAKSEQALWNKRNTIHKAYLGYLKGERMAREKAERLKRTEIEKTSRLEIKRIKEVRKVETTVTRERNKSLKGLVGIPAFRRPFRVAMILSITTLVADALAFVGTGINALGAGAIAGVNGLAPLAGMLITIPALFTALAQSIAPATWGIKNFVNAWKGDEKSLKDAGKNTLALSKAIKKLKPEFDKMQKSVGERFIQGFDKSFGKLGNVYLPILKKRLNGTAAAFNTVLLAGMKWFSSARGQSVVDTIMGTNNAIIKGGGGGVLNIIKGVGGLLKAASPMLRTAAADFKTWSRDLQKKIFGNQKGLSGFFDKSYKTFKGVTGTLGNFGSGIYNLFKQSAPLTEHMGGAIKQAGIDFMNWTKGDGIPKIQKFFKDMQPNLDSVVSLAGSLGTTLFNISQSPNFAKTVDEIRLNLLPALEKIIKAADGKFIPNLVKFAEALAKLADGGVIDALSDLGADMAAAFDWAAGKFNLLPDALQSGIVKAIVLVGIFGGLAGIVAGLVGNLLKALALTGRMLRMGGGVFGFGGGFGRGGKNGGGGKGGGGGPVIAGGGGGKKGGSKPGKKTGTGVAVGGGGGGKKPKKGGSKPGKPTGSTRANGGNNKNNPAKGKPSRKQVAGGAAGGLGGALAFLGAGPAADQIDGVAGAMADVEFKANALMTSGRSLDGLFGDIAQGNMQTFNGALTQVANPDKYMKFEQGVAAVGGAILGATPPLDVAKAKFEGIDTALTNMPAAEAATNFSKIRQQANQMGVPMEKLTALFPQYRDSVAGTVTATDKAAGGMGNATVAANKMAGVVGGPVKNSLMDVDSMQIKPKMSVQDEATPKVAAVGSNIKTLDQLTVTPGIKVQSDAPQKGAQAKTAMKVPNSTPKIDVGTNASQVAGAARSAMNIPDTQAFIRITTIRTTTGAGGSAKTAGKSTMGGDVKNWTGGTVGAGRISEVAEHGAEFALTRGGNLSLLSGRGLFRASEETAIIPAGATRDPFGGNYGQAPDWARKMLQGAAGAHPANGMRSSGQPSTFAPNVKIEVNNASQNIDMRRAVRDALTDIQYDREGRR